MPRILLPFLVLLTACAAPPAEPVGDAATAPGGRPVIYTVNYPLAYFAERIAGDRARVVFPAPADVDPAVWSPSAEVVAEYQTADRILLNGAGYADWIERVSLSPSRLVDTSASFSADYVEVVGDVTHTHGPEGAHSHGEIASTIWLDPRLAFEQARAVHRALGPLLPEDETELQSAVAALGEDLNSVDEAIERLVAADPGRPLLASHPVYQYLQARYGLNLVSLHWEPHEVPDEAEWGALTERLEDHRATWMLWEAPPLDEIRTRLESLGVASVVFAPCGNRPAAGDFLDVMRQNVRELGRVYEK